MAKRGSRRRAPVARRAPVRRSVARGAPRRVARPRGAASVRRGSGVLKIVIEQAGVSSAAPYMGNVHPILPSQVSPKRSKF